jgi:hypothetical protein
MYQCDLLLCAPNWRELALFDVGVKPECLNEDL